MRRTKVLIYDCDGVLFDSKRANQAFYNHILQKFGLPPMSPEQLDFVHVSTAHEALDELFRFSSYREQAQAYLREMDYRPFIPLMEMEPNLRETLERLRPKYRTAIATNRDRSMPQVMREHRLEELFDLTITSGDVREPKPHPESLLKILDHFGVKPEEALYVGDAEVDRAVSDRAGVPFVAYKNRRLKAAYHIQDHLELLRILEEPKKAH